MRVVGSTILCLQAVVLLLALPVATAVNGVDAGTAWAACAGVALLCILTVGVITKPIGVALGWTAQIGTAALAFFVPWLLVLAVVFTLLWWGALRVTRKVAQVDAARHAESGAD
jgi:hypothetical protein